MTAVTSLRTERQAKVAYILVIEGLPWIWTDSHDAGLLGKGASSWIGKSEQDLIDQGATEQVGYREVLQGLDLPASIRMPTLDVYDMRLSDAGATFSLVGDTRLRDAALNAGTTPDRLAEYIPAGTTALGTSLKIGDPNNPQTTNPRGKWIGVEAIGPSGQRGFYPSLPIVPSMPGPEHFHNNAIYAEGGRRDPVTSSPYVLEGRRCCLYRLYYDHHLGTWPLWREQYEAGGLVWWGTLSRIRSIRGMRTVEIQCDGPMSWLSRSLDVRTNVRGDDGEGVPIRGVVTLGSNETTAACWARQYNYSVPEYGDYGAKVITLTGTSKPALIAEIAQLIDDVTKGVGLTQSPDPDYGSPQSPGVDGSKWDASMSGDKVQVWVDPSHVGTTKEDVFWLELTLHRNAWRALGWDIDSQGISPNTVPVNSELQVNAKKLDEGKDLFGTPTPAPDYYTAYISTSPVGRHYLLTGTVNSNNEGNPRIYKPLIDSNDFGILTKDSGGIVAVGTGFEVDTWYCQGNPAISFTSEQVGTDAPNSAAVWLFEGDMVTVDKDGNEDTVELRLPALVEWRNDSKAAGNGDDGMIDTRTSDGIVAVRVRKWLDPRDFGIDADPLDRDWLYTEAHNVRARVLPIYTYADGQPLPLYQAIIQALVSTGTAGGWSGAEDTQPTMTFGGNAPSDATGPHKWATDAVAASMGLAIPRQLIASLGQWVEALGDEQVYWGADGPIKVADVLQQLLGNRGHVLRLHGRQYGTASLVAGATQDLTLTEQDVAGEPGAPRTTIPQQEVGVTRPFDYVEISQDGRIFGETESVSRGEALDDGMPLRSTNNRKTVRDPFSLMSISWRRDMAEFFAGRHTVVRGLPLMLRAGQDAMPGSTVMLTHGWVLAPDGTEGVTAHRGVVIGVSHGLRERPVQVDVLLHEDGAGGAGSNAFAPLARVFAYDSTSRTITLYQDFRQIGSEDAGYQYDTTGFSEPAWSTGGGTTYVQAWYWAGEVDSVGRPLWRQGPKAPVASVSGNTVTLAADWSSWTGPDGPRTDLVRSFEWWITLVSADDANCPQWARDVYSPIVTTDTMQTPGGTPGKEWLP